MTGQFVDCNCADGDKCPQGKTGPRTRCFIPVEKATVGARTVAGIFDPIPPAKPEPAPMCKGDWLIGTACGTCSRCIAAAKPLIEHFKQKIEHFKQNIGQCEAELAVIWACVPLPEGDRDVSDEFKVHCFNEIRRMRTPAGS